MLPWTLTKDSYDYIATFPAEQQEDALQTYLFFNRNSFKVPTYALFVMYVGFSILILGSGAVNLFRKVSPSSYKSIRTRLAPLRTHLVEAPLFGGSNAEPVPLLGIRWLTVQLPLRLQSIIIFAILLINIVPALAFYTYLPGERNVFWPDPHSRRSQFERTLSDRTGILATGQIPLLILMAGRRSPAAFISGLGMNELMLYHRWIARMVWAQALVHGVGYTIICIRAKDLASEYKEAYWNWGVAALFMFSGLTFLSLRWLRNKWYEIFVFLHIIMGVLVLVGVYLHIKLIEYSPYALYVIMIEISAVLWGLDRLLRLTNRYVTSIHLKRSEGKVVKKLTEAEVDFLSGGKVARLRIAMPSWRVRPTKFGGNEESLDWIPRIGAGDSIMLTIPRLQFVGDHPFSVFRSGVSVSEGEGGREEAFLEVMVGIKGGMTAKLLKLKGDSEEVGVKSESRKGGKKLTVFVDGPYDPQPTFEEVDHLILFAGGIGVTFCVPYLARSVHERKWKSCKLVWMVRDLDMLEILNEQLLELESALGQNSRSEGLLMPSLSIEVYHTSSTLDTTTMPLVGSSSTSSEDEKNLEEVDSLKGDDATDSEKGKVQGGGSADFWSSREGGKAICVTMRSGRPSGRVESPTGSRQESVGVIACGPKSLCDWARKEALHLRRSGCSSDVELHTECVLW
ncbi:hypothetical protein IE53DRAFT_376654 [Violaceomyces palustris]|uniref:Uncharacterized protein n=1 Tax=Violaceomyces palustris TaxID=1673888 RepID=A0ACD0P8B9_9BASI|nr:hypothetical protein IE53DRAFT_376654 [Violaceomyces palustris]